MIVGVFVFEFKGFDVELKVLLLSIHLLLLLLHPIFQHQKFLVVDDENYDSGGHG